MIWEPLVLYFIVPPLIFVGCALILLSKQKRNQFVGLHLLIIGLSFTLPSVLGFDLDTDLKGRWSGVLVAVFATVLTTTDILKELRTNGLYNLIKTAVNKNDLQQKL